MKNLKTFLLLTLLPAFALAQQAIVLDNPSFEGKPGSSRVPMGWSSCGPTGETDPDIQPGFFGCTLTAAEGSSFVGMVTRDNYTWESLSQKLSAPLDSGICYAFSVRLASSPEYVSGSRMTGKMVNYSAPVVFRVWGGYGACDAQVLLAESSSIGHNDWKKYRFMVRHLEARPLTHLIFEAFYAPGLRCQPTNGNLLMDDLSAIETVSCLTFATDTLRDARVFVPALPELTSDPDLDALLKTHLSNVEYRSRWEKIFVCDCKENHEGLPILFSRELLTAAAAMRLFPDKKLILRTKNASSSNRKPRAAFLKKYLIDAGLPEKQVQVMPEQIDERRTWKVDTKWLSADW